MKFIIFFLFALYSNASIFSIAVCTTSSIEAANSCQKSILKDSKLEVFILEDKKDKKFRTYLGKFESYEEAKNTLSTSSAFIKKQNAFVKKLEELKTIKKKSIPQVVSITPNEDLEFKKYLEEIKVLNSLHKPILKENIEKDLFSQIKNYSKLIVEVNSKKNTMSLKANNNEKLINIKTYIVSTAKETSKKPLGLGSITAISLKPQWYPTENTLKSFRQKGINLPSVVPFGHKLNYMGAAKINLTHKVDGREVYRIHGTLNEDTIGTNESSGCIRMKNDEVIELASLLKNFADFKGYNNIQVILR
ncbi:MAG: L,D-transpeptidase family protein [Aliarcobacter sp.]|nr:L,D-transpeptidase family protein [Aliarcobacter sp.]